MFVLILVMCFENENFVNCVLYNTTTGQGLSKGLDCCSMTAPLLCPVWACGSVIFSPDPVTMETGYIGHGEAFNLKFGQATFCFYCKFTVVKILGPQLTTSLITLAKSSVFCTCAFSHSLLTDGFVQKPPGKAYC